VRLQRLKSDVFRCTIERVNTLPAIQYLTSRNATFRLFEHTGPIHSLEQAAAERSQQPEQVVRSIVFRLAENEFLMVLMSGPGQIPWKGLRRYLGQSRITMATEEDLLTWTGYVPGTVNPFGLPQPMRLLIDQGVLDQPEVSLGSGKRGLAILMSPTELVQAVDQYEIVNFSDENG